MSMDEFNSRQAAPSATWILSSCDPNVRPGLLPDKDQSHGQVKGHQLHSKKKWLLSKVQFVLFALANLAVLSSPNTS